MIKSFVILKKKPNLSQEEFLRYWKEEHGPLVARLIPGLRKYIQNHPLRMPGVESHIDGIAETWWDSVESLQAYLNWRQSEEGKVLIEDEKKFADSNSVVRFLSEEQVLLKG